MSNPPTEKQSATGLHLTKAEFDKLPDIAKEAITTSGIPLSITAVVGEESRTFSVKTVDVDKESQNLAGILGTLRWDWGNRNGDWILRLNWGVVGANTAAFVAIGEGAAGGPTAGKFIGNAKFTLFNVAPRSGGVDIWVNVNWNNPIRLYVDYLIVTIDQFGP